MKIIKVSQITNRKLCYALKHEMSTQYTRSSILIKVSIVPRTVFQVECD